MNKHKNGKLTALALVLAGLVLVSSACSAASASSGTESSPEPTATAEPTEAPTPTPEPTEEPTPEPEDEDGTLDDGHNSMLPAPEAGSEAFQEAFADNPIDAQFMEDLFSAGSVSAMVEACNTASESWQAQVESAFMQLMEDETAEVTERVSAAHAYWQENESESLREIRESVNEEDPMAAYTVAEGIMLYYRTHAIELSAELFEITGELSFG